MPSDLIWVPLLMTGQKYRIGAGLATDPGVAALMWLVPVMVGVFTSWDALAWVGLGGTAGYALSGSV
jgi:hypothetical protein